MSLLQSDFLSCIHSTSGKTDEGMHERKPSMLSIVAADVNMVGTGPVLTCLSYRVCPFLRVCFRRPKKEKKKEETGDVIGHNLGVATSNAATQQPSK
jgi:hypothetical protein